MEDQTNVDSGTETEDKKKKKTTVKDAGLVHDALGGGAHDAEGKGTILQTLEPVANAQAAANMATIATPKMESADVDECMGALFSDETLSEEFSSKVRIVFEAAVNTKIDEYSKSIQESYDDVIKEQLTNVVSDLSEKLDDYLNYVVTEWMEENELAVERGIKSDIAESFISGIKNLFENHYIDVPNERYDVLDELFEANEQLQAQLNEQIERNIDLFNEIKTSKAQEIYTESVSDLTETQREKFLGLAQNVTFEDEADFSKKLDALKENYFPLEPQGILSESMDPMSEEDTGSTRPLSEDSSMNVYVNHLQNQMKFQKKSN
tara:strand:- start:8666 stop:9631 length:966 start_codon:yes stop_codon:yes gene_type:complete